jgi:hypothetical protein
MKCVKMFDGDYKDRVVRVTDEMAREIVSDGRGEYAPKEPWKDGGREAPKGRV